MENEGDGEAVVVRRSVEPTHGFGRIVESLGYDITETVETERREHGRYNVGPDSLKRLRRLSEGGTRYVAFDNVLHPGQTADLASELPDALVRDRRATVYERLSDAGGEAAGTKLRIWEARVERRHLLNQSRSEESGVEQTEGRIGDIDRRIRSLTSSLEGIQEKKRDSIVGAYADADAHVAVTGDIPSPTSVVRKAIAGSAEPESVVSLDAEPLSPAEPTTHSGSVGSYSVSVTECPGVPVPRGLPEWYSEAVPGAVAALERSDVVVVEQTGGPSDHGWTDAFEADVVGVEVSDDTTRDEILSAVSSSQVFSVRRLRITLPYTDGAQSFVSRMYDRSEVCDVEYGENVYIEVEVPEDRVDEVSSEASEVGGRAEPME